VRQRSRRSLYLEGVAEAGLFVAALLSVFVTIGILWILLKESLPLFLHISLVDFFTDTEWMPLFEPARYGILPLISGTLSTTLVALSVAVPAGLIIAIYLSEYASPSNRQRLKPILELLSAVPTVVYGYFALLVVSPLLARIITDLPGFNVLSAGLVMGVMIIPYISSLSEDALAAVPGSLREASMAMGATRLQTAFKVVLPTAVSGVTAAVILGLSRAVGETMIVAIAAGMQPNLTLNPLEPAQTMTSYIVQVSLGDLPHGTVGYQTIFAVGLCLCLITFTFNIAGHYVRKRFRESL
jgi:phosphate transport system permease protein